MQNVSPEVQVFFSLLVQAAIPALGTILLGFAVFAANSAVTWIKAHASQTQLLQVKTIIDLLVAAAQQSGLSDALSNEGAAKKQWVLDSLDSFLRTHGLSTFADDIPLLDKLIEAGVYELTKIKTPPIFDTPELPTAPVSVG